MVTNVHERKIPASAAAVASLIATLASKEDRLWPHEAWPRMKLNAGLAAGSVGGHGPVRYEVVKVDPAGRVVFQFTGPVGFVGWHAFEVADPQKGKSVLRHELQMEVRGLSRLTWPLFFRPMHDALIEEAFDKAERELGATEGVPFRRGVWVRSIYWLAALAGRARRPARE